MVVPSAKTGPRGVATTLDGGVDVGANAMRAGCVAAKMPQNRRR